MAKERSREEVLAALEVAEAEEGRTGLVKAYLKDNPTPKTTKKTK